MTSDYIARLRAELLRAGAAGPAPRRRGTRALRPLAAVAAVGLLIVAIAVMWPSERSDETPVAGDLIAWTYRTDRSTVSAQLLRERFDAAGIAATVTAGDGTLTVTASGSARVAVTALTVPGRFVMYDWERSVLGSDGTPAPTDPAVTGGANAGQTPVLTEEQARSRAGLKPGARALQARPWLVRARGRARADQRGSGGRARRRGAHGRAGGRPRPHAARPGGVHDPHPRALTARRRPRHVRQRARVLSAPRARARRPHPRHPVRQLAGSAGRASPRQHPRCADARPGEADGRGAQHRPPSRSAREAVGFRPWRMRAT